MARKLSTNEIRQHRNHHTTMKKYISLLLLLVSATIFTACNDGDEYTFTPNQGQVRFQFILSKTYTLTSIKDVYSLIVTLEKDGQKITLPSQIMAGNEDVISTQYVTLPTGDYKLVSYKAFNFNGNLIDILDIKLEKDNEFAIKYGEQTTFVIPLQVKQYISLDATYNMLYALCLEVLGKDKSKWPKSWDFENDQIDYTWEGLEFSTDDFGNIAGVSGLIIDGNPRYFMNEDGEWQYGSLVEFKHMKKLPACVAKLASLENLNIRNCDLEELPKEMYLSNITSLSIVNTNIKSLPDEVGDMKRLNNISLSNNKFTEFPECVTRLKDIIYFDTINEKITSIPESIKSWKKVTSLRFTGTEITELPDVFNDLHILACLDLKDNKSLSTLPASMVDIKVPYDNHSYTRKALRTLILDGCAFTEIPSVLVQENTGFLSMKDNQITRVRKEDIEKMTDLQTLILDRNPLQSFPQINHRKLGMLSLIDCGLEKSDVDVSGLPSLPSTHLFFTQEKADLILNTNWDIPYNDF